MSALEKNLSIDKNVGIRFDLDLDRRRRPSFLEVTSEAEEPQKIFQMIFPESREKVRSTWLANSVEQSDGRDPPFKSR